MIIQFTNLSQEEKESISYLENVNPECAVREFKASLDGETILQLIIPTIIPAVVSIITTIINRKRKPEPEKYHPVIITVLIEGKEIPINNISDLPNLPDGIAPKQLDTDGKVGKNA